MIFEVVRVIRFAQVKQLYEFFLVENSVGHDLILGELGILANAEFALNVAFDLIDLEFRCRDPIKASCQKAERQEQNNQTR
jgi:hypothetical protein